MRGNKYSSKKPLLRLIVIGLCCASLFVLVAVTACKRMEDSLTRGLEEEKSYSRHAMEYHRDHPDERRGDNVLETWSQADYIAVNTTKQKLSGEWAKPSIQLQFLPAELRSDSSGRPFCVIQTAEAVIVLHFLDKINNECTIETAKHLDVSGIQSGDMFAGRTDYWIYVLRRPYLQG